MVLAQHVVGVVGAWWAAGHVITLPRWWLSCVILVLVGLSIVALSEARAGVHEGSMLLFEPWPLSFTTVLLVVAGGELLLHGLDIEFAGSLSLMVSLADHHRRPRPRDARRTLRRGEHADR